VLVARYCEEKDVVVDSYKSDVLQLAEQIFSLSLPQIMKYCVMRECENIHSWISLVGDLAFSHIWF